MQTFTGDILHATRRAAGSKTLHTFTVNGVKHTERRSATMTYRVAWVRRVQRASADAPAHTRYVVVGWSGTAERPPRDCFAVYVDPV